MGGSTPILSGPYLAPSSDLSPRYIQESVLELSHMQGSMDFGAASHDYVSGSGGGFRRQES